ncbi:RHO1 GDP-GTP exchange protein 2 [Tulasnella sp. 332]|nr:RHO1 GDP-GTP exchange protein 2 [Tulasnella sp. 332]
MNSTTATKPDKRSTAFENIFGRPKVAQGYDPAQYYSQPTASTSQQPISYPATYGTPPATSPSPPLYALPQGAAVPVYTRASYYPQAPQGIPQQQYYHQNPIQNQHQQVIVQQQQQIMSPVIQYTTHLQPHMTGASGQYQLPHSPEPPDPDVQQHLALQTLSPAQQYQAQVYLNSPMNHPYQQPHPASRTTEYASHQTPRTDILTLPKGAARASYQQPPTRLPPLPPLPDVEVGMGSLGLTDFDTTTTSLDDDEDEDDRDELDGSSNEIQWSQPRSHSNGARQVHSNSSSISRKSRHKSEAYSASPAADPSPPSNQYFEPSSPAMSTLTHNTSQNSNYSHNHNRRSSDSFRTMSGQPVSRRTDGAASRSKSAVTPKTQSMVDIGLATPHAGHNNHPLPMSNISTPRQSMSHNPHNPHHHHHHPHHSRRGPIVYPALLSRVAEAFKARITLSERGKDGLAYQDAFDGREAVDKIAYIIKTTDRNLALLLGRALDAQKFFHDVTYDHRLRDSPNELYQFKSRLPTPFVSEDIANPMSAIPNGGATRNLSSVAGSISSSVSTRSDLASPTTSMSTTSMSTAPLSASRPRPASISSTDDVPLPSGVFTLLTDCYSPTCTRDALCYSIACPRRLEQQARLNMRPDPGLRRSISHESMGDYLPQEAGILWIHSVPQHVVDSVSDQEKKRQESINEVIYTERDFVRDMEYLRDVWMKPLLNSDIIPEARRISFIQDVFWNVEHIISVNTRLRDALNKRQKSYAIVEAIGDIFLDVVTDFEPFVSYGSHQLYGKFEFEKEKSTNPAFAHFVEENERLPESRKLELNGYLTKPTTRLARYPLLLDVVAKHTSDDNPDKARLAEVVKIVRGFLTRVNEESGKAENKFNLAQLDQQLVFRNIEPVDLRLRDENRELLYKGQLKRRGGNANENGDLQVFLFDHALLMVKAKTKHEQFRVFKRPIPLELLVVSALEEVAPGRPATAKPRQTIMKRSSFSKDSASSAPSSLASSSTNVRASSTTSILPIPLRERDSNNNKNGYAITFMHLGRKGYSMTLWASTPIGRRKWLEAIAKQQDAMRKGSLMFDMMPLSESFFLGQNKVNCAVPFNQGMQVAYGTDTGVYFSDLKDRSKNPIQVLALPDIIQVDVLEEYELLVVLSERTVLSFPMDALDPSDPTAALRRGKKESSHTTFFKAGTCLGRTLLCIVKASALSSTIKTLEPIDQNVRAKNKPTFRKLLQGGNEMLKVFKEFYIPTESSSIHFLKTKLCVGCTKGFEIVDLETLDTQGLLDPADATLDFVQKKENTRPIAIYRIENDFLLCYDEFAFYVNKSGWRARPEWIVHWEGSPTSFALYYPFVLAVEPTFIEVRHVDSGRLVQIIPGNNLRCLFADTPPSQTHSPANCYGPNGYIRSGNPYTHPSNGRNSLPQQQFAGGAYPVGYGYQHQGGQGSPIHRSQTYARDEIIIVSDDKVLSVRLAAPLAMRHTRGASSLDGMGEGG